MDTEVKNLQQELKKEIEGYLPEFLTDAYPGQEKRVAELLKNHDFTLITGMNARFSGVKEVDRRWTMIKFYYGITVFDDNLPWLCDLSTKE